MDVSSRCMWLVARFLNINIVNFSDITFIDYNQLFALLTTDCIVLTQVIWGRERARLSALLRSLSFIAELAHIFYSFRVLNLLELLPCWRHRSLCLLLLFLSLGHCRFYLLSECQISLTYSGVLLCK